MSLKYLYLLVTLLSAAARSQRKLRADISVRPCNCSARVYVYDLEPPLTDPGYGAAYNPFRRRPDTSGPWDPNETVVHGPSYMSAHALTSILEYRLRRSCCRTTDPEEADLFFAPIAPRPRWGNKYRALCESGNLSATEVRRQLRHARDPGRACRHFVSVPHQGNFKQCGGWFAHPKPPYELMMRVGYLHSITPSLERRVRADALNSRAQPSHLWADLDKVSTERSSEYPNLISVPYPSVHWSSDRSRAGISPPWERSHDSRPHPPTMLFVGSVTHGDVLVRALVAKQCEAHPRCTVSPWRGGASLLDKQRATFCLEPSGDTPDRKSVSDDVAMGCIPVFFSVISSGLAPWFWAAAGSPGEGYVLIEREPFLVGNVTLESELGRMPSTRVAALGRAVTRVAHGFQYSIDDDPGDAVDVLLTGLHKMADAQCPHRRISRPISNTSNSLERKPGYHVL